MDNELEFTTLIKVLEHSGLPDHAEVAKALKTLVGRAHDDEARIKKQDDLIREYHSLSRDLTFVHYRNAPTYFGKAKCGKCKQKWPCDTAAIMRQHILFSANKLHGDTRSLATLQHTDVMYD